MGFYGEWILPRIIDRFMAGLNLPYYPSDVRKLHALDPAKLGRKLAEGRLADCSFPVEYLDLEGESIPLAEDSVDAAVCTWTLCTIPEPGRALREVRRVLKPQSRFHFVEHGRSSDSDVARWQDRLTPFHRLYSGGCHLNRQIDAILREAGFELQQVENVYMRGPRVGSYLYKALAVGRR